MNNASKTVIILFLAVIITCFIYLVVIGMEIGVSLLMEVASFFLFAAGVCAAAYAVKRLADYAKRRIKGIRRPHSKE